MVARSRDLARNSGWASGGIVRILDNVVGTHLRLLASPDWRALALRFNKPAFDAVWADEFRKWAEAHWRGYADSPGRWNDVSRMLSMGQQFRVALRHKLIDGDSLFLTYWLPERVGYGAADYATAFMLIDPDRLSNPLQALDSKYLRGRKRRARPVRRASGGYHIREAEQNDWYNALEANRWERVLREDDDGWRRVVHDFDADRAGQHRGIGVFTSVLSHMRMLAKYYGVELQQATISAMFGTYLTSPNDPALMQDALGGGDPQDSDLSAYQSMRSEFGKDRPALFNGAVVPSLFPGEKIESVASAHPHANFGDFAHEMLCVFAAATGISVEQVTQGLVTCTNCPFERPRRADGDVEDALAPARRVRAEHRLSDVRRVVARGDGHRPAAASVRRPRIRRSGRGVRAVPLARAGPRVGGSDERAGRDDPAPRGRHVDARSLSGGAGR